MLSEKFEKIMFALHHQSKNKCSTLKSDENETSETW